MVFIAVFSICALVPPAGLLVALRPYRRFWTVLATLVVAMAITGLAAAAPLAAGPPARGAPRGAPRRVWGRAPPRPPRRRARRGGPPRQRVPARHAGHALGAPDPDGAAPRD